MSQGGCDDSGIGNSVENNSAGSLSPLGSPNKSRHPSLLTQITPLQIEDEDDCVIRVCQQPVYINSPLSPNAANESSLISPFRTEMMRRSLPTSHYFPPTISESVDFSLRRSESWQQTKLPIAPPRSDSFGSMTNSIQDRTSSYGGATSPQSFDKSSIFDTELSSDIDYIEDMERRYEEEMQALRSKQHYLKTIKAEAEARRQGALTASLNREQRSTLSSPGVMSTASVNWTKSSQSLPPGFEGSSIPLKPIHAPLKRSNSDSDPYSPPERLPEFLRSTVNTPGHAPKEFVEGKLISLSASSASESSSDEDDAKTKIDVMEELKSAFEQEQLNQQLKGKRLNIESLSEAETNSQSLMEKFLNSQAEEGHCEEPTTPVNNKSSNVSPSFTETSGEYRVAGFDGSNSNSGSFVAFGGNRSTGNSGIAISQFAGKNELGEEDDILSVETDLPISGGPISGYKPTLDTVVDEDESSKTSTPSVPAQSNNKQTEVAQIIKSQASTDVGLTVVSSSSSDLPSAHQTPTVANSRNSNTACSVPSPHFSAVDYEINDEEIPKPKSKDKLENVDEVETLKRELKLLQDKLEKVSKEKSSKKHKDQSTANGNAVQLPQNDSHDDRLEKPVENRTSSKNPAQQKKDAEDERHRMVKNRVLEEVHQLRQLNLKLLKEKFAFEPSQNSTAEKLAQEEMEKAQRVVMKIEEKLSALYIRLIDCDRDLGDDPWAGIHQEASLGLREADMQRQSIEHWLAKGRRPSSSFTRPKRRSGSPNYDSDEHSEKENAVAAIKLKRRQKSLKSGQKKRHSGEQTPSDNHKGSDIWVFRDGNKSANDGEDIWVQDNSLMGERKSASAEDLSPNKNTKKITPNDFNQLKLGVTSSLSSTSSLLTSSDALGDVQQRRRMRQNVTNAQNNIMQSTAADEELPFGLKLELRDPRLHKRGSMHNAPHTSTLVPTELIDVHSTPVSHPSRSTHDAARIYPPVNKKMDLIYDQDFNDKDNFRNRIASEKHRQWNEESSDSVDLLSPSRSAPKQQRRGLIVVDKHPTPDPTININSTPSLHAKSPKMRIRETSFIDVSPKTRDLTVVSPNEINSSTLPTPTAHGFTSPVSSQMNSRPDTPGSLSGSVRHIPIYFEGKNVIATTTGIYRIRAPLNDLQGCENRARRRRKGPQRGLSGYYSDGGFDGSKSDSELMSGSTRSLEKRVKFSDAPPQISKIKAKRSLSLKSRIQKIQMKEKRSSENSELGSRSDPHLNLSYDCIDNRDQVLTPNENRSHSLQTTPSKSLATQPSRLNAIPCYYRIMPDNRIQVLYPNSNEVYQYSYSKTPPPTSKNASMQLIQQVTASGELAEEKLYFYDPVQLDRSGPNRNQKQQKFSPSWFKQLAVRSVSRLADDSDDADDEFCAADDEYSPQHRRAQRHWLGKKKSAIKDFVKQTSLSLQKKAHRQPADAYYVTD